MDNLRILSNRHREYNVILNKLKIDKNKNYSFNTGGKLIISLIEFRTLYEIEQVLAAVLKVYEPNEIGLSIMYGNNNKSYIESTFKKWKNIILIHKNFDNIDRRIYSALLRQPEYYEMHNEWDNILIYQTDALIFRKIDDIYFKYDYIGAPWVESNQWCKYNAGNGGFSLRKIKSCIRVCEKYRNVEFSKIPRGNEDGFFCNQESFIYPPINSELHKAFSVERVKYKHPVGCHQLYLNTSMTLTEWKDILNYMRETLLKSKIFTIDTNKLSLKTKNIVVEDKYNISNIKENILAFDLFSGVGYYNQLFSLELAVYLANISKRYLILNIRFPLAACGKPNKDYGLLLDFVNKEYKKYLIGLEARIYKNYVDPSEKEQTLPTKMSSQVIVDEDLYTPSNMNDIKDFAHHRNVLNGKNFNKIFNNNEKLVYFSKSNASRLFTNFYTSKINYELMNNIAHSLSKYNPVLTNICENVRTNIHKKYLSIHLRMGDWRQSINETNNKIIINNIKNWLDKNNTENLPIYIMTDKLNNPLLNQLEKWNIIYVESLITDEIKLELNKYYKDTNVAEFLIQKYIVERSYTFIGSYSSTVTAHIHYNRYKNNNSMILYTHSKQASFDNNTLSFKEVNNKKYSWKRKQLQGGHPLSWAIFTTDNILPIINLKNLVDNTEETDRDMKLIISENYEENTKIDNSEPFMSVDVWLKYSNIIIKDKRDIINYKYNKSVPVIFLKTDLLPNYIDQLNLINFPFILITASNDDQCPPYLVFPHNDNSYPGLKEKADQLLNKSNLKVWYAKNPAINHDKLKAYPVGPKWQWRTTRFYGEDKTDHLNIFKKFGLNPKESMHDIELKQNLLYFNFTTSSNNALFEPHRNIENNCKSDLLNNGFKLNVKGQYEDYIKTLSTYKFIATPPERGIDSHKCWEGLMVGTIPIVISSSLDELYKELPVIIVKSYKEITHEYLNKKYDEMTKLSYNFEKIYSDYWIKKINDQKIIL